MPYCMTENETGMPEKSGRREKTRIRNIVDLASFIPGLAILPTPQNLANITIRGLGTGAGNETYDQSVGLFIDGVYAGAPASNPMSRTRE